MSLIRRGDIAVCRRGAIGLITEASPQWVKYPDGNEGYTFVGVHLTNKMAPIGSPWSSRNPRIVSHIAKLLAESNITQIIHDEDNATNHRISECGDNYKL